MGRDTHLLGESRSVRRLVGLPIIRSSHAAPIQEYPTPLTTTDEDSCHKNTLRLGDAACTVEKTRLCDAKDSVSRCNLDNNKQHDELPL